jgi:SAM-dependent methyltransferase
MHWPLCKPLDLICALDGEAYVMNKRQLDHFDVIAAKKEFARGGNITELLRRQNNSNCNTPEIIEVAYDLQAGTYIDAVEKNPNLLALYTAELAEILSQYIKPSSSILDIGTGELTTLSLVVRELEKKPSDIFAFDISWSRIYKGIRFAQKRMGKDFQRLTPFVGDIGDIPLLDKSISITTSSHALEPNGGKLKELMEELFRVTVDKLILFEPCYEIAGKEGKERMDKLGYIKNIDETVEALGGKVIEKMIIKNISNQLNPTVCFVIKPPSTDARREFYKRSAFSVPGTNIPLQKEDDFYYSVQTGLCYPVLKNIPILKSNNAILATSLLD